MANSIKVDENCDIVFDELGCALMTETDEEDIAQAIYVELSQNYGQWEIDETFGTKYVNSENTGVLQQKNNLEKIIIEVTRVINKHPIKKINSIKFNENKELVIEIVLNNEVVVIKV